MTALDQYVRLEAAGIWRESADAPPREVIVAFGNATITLTDLADRPLGHWALAGMQVYGQDGDATLYAMNTDGSETLAIRDRDMVAAIAAVAKGEITPSPATARPRRRASLAGPLVLGLVLLGVAAVGPGVVRSQAIRMVPEEQAAEFGDRMLISLMETGGGLCAEVAGSRALDRIAARLVPEGPTPRLRVLGLAGTPVAALPGHTVLIDRAAVAEATAPEVIAGWIELALARVPVDRMMETVGPVQDLRYVLTGEIGATGLARAAEAAIRPPLPTEVPEAIARLKRQGIDPAPFEAALAQKGLLPRPGTEGDAGFTAAAARAKAPPLLTDQDWAALKDICD